MKRYTFFLTGLTVALYLCAVPGFAQHGHGGGGGHGAMSTHGGGKSRGKAGKEPSGMAGKKTVGELLSENRQLSSKLQALLPPGTNLQEAAKGFKNLGQFVATVHVSHNLDIPFDELRSKMTGPHSESLGKAIHALRPDADAKAEGKKARKKADDDMKESGS